MKTRSLLPLSIAIAMGGVWDTVAGLFYLFIIGTGRPIDDPAIHPFYAIFLGSFFLCFAYLQILSSFKIGRYAFNIGCLVFGRLFYVLILFCFMLYEKDFPSTFWFTGIIDGVLTILYIVFAISGGLHFRDLFVPVTDNSSTNKP